MRILGICCISILLVLGCETQDRNENLSPYENVAAVNTLLLSPINIAMAFANHQLDEVVDYHINIDVFDTTQLDGTPFAASVDFGSGFLGKDGHKRGGIWMIQWHEGLVGEIDTVWMNLAANYADTGYQNVRLSWNDEEVYTNGLLLLVKKKNQFELQLDLTLQTTKFKFMSNLTALASVNNDKLISPSVWDQTSFEWGGEFIQTIRSSNEQFTYAISAENLSRKSGCIKGFTKGAMHCTQKQPNDNEDFSFDFDPFGDEPCDEKALLIKGKTERVITLW